MPVDRLYGQSGRDIVSAPAVAQPQPVNCRSPAADEPRPGGRRSRGDRTWRSPARPASHARRLPCCRRRLRRADPAAAQEQDPGHVPTLPPCGTTAPRLKASLTVVRPNPARRASRVFVRPNVTSPASRRARNSLSVRRRILEIGMVTRCRPPACCSTVFIFVRSHPGAQALHDTRPHVRPHRVKEAVRTAARVRTFSLLQTVSLATGLISVCGGRAGQQIEDLEPAGPSGRPRGERLCGAAGLEPVRQGEGALECVHGVRRAAWPMI